MTTNKKRYAKVHWTIDDIKGEKPDWTDKQCRDFLNMIEDHLADAMVEAGWSYIDYRLNEEEKSE